MNPYNSVRKYAYDTNALVRKLHSASIPSIQTIIVQKTHFASYLEGRFLAGIQWEKISLTPKYARMHAYAYAKRNTHVNCIIMHARI